MADFDASDVSVSESWADAQADTPTMGEGHSGSELRFKINPCLIVGPYYPPAIIVVRMIIRIDDFNRPILNFSRDFSDLIKREKRKSGRRKILSFINSKSQSHTT
ncbi:unnamed protein product [Orchesella dallaii]|uniref:Uncharacterized protein n=1 Tax=Orchesella dallaii TaxID=48710 RepID=A0ABP1QNM2_9HEXA